MMFGWRYSPSLIYSKFLAESIILVQLGQDEYGIYYTVLMPMLKNSKVISFNTTAKSISLLEQPALGTLLTLAASQNK